MKLMPENVRVKITLWAALFYFGGGALMIAYLLLAGNEEGIRFAEKSFFTIGATAVMCIGYWFGNRRDESLKDNSTETQ